jgi:hypothetical protein
VPSAKKFRSQINVKKVGAKQDVSIGKDSGRQNIREGEGIKRGGSFGIEVGGRSTKFSHTAVWSCVGTEEYIRQCKITRGSM